MPKLKKILRVLIACELSGIVRDAFKKRGHYAPIQCICIENPVGIISTKIRKPDQIMQPWQFGQSIQKKTCLWLKNLPLLKPTKIVDRGWFAVFESGKMMPKWYYDASLLPRKERSKRREKFFPGIAAAMASQWGQKLISEIVKRKNSENGRQK